MCDQLRGTCHHEFYRHDVEVHETVESQVKHTVISARQVRHDGQWVPRQHLLALVTHQTPSVSRQRLVVCSSSASKSLSSRHFGGPWEASPEPRLCPQCLRLPQIASYRSGLDIEGRCRVCCLRLLATLVERHEQVLLPQEGSLHGADEVRLEADEVLLLHPSLLKDLFLIGQAFTELLRQPFPLLQLPRVC